MSIKKNSVQSPPAIALLEMDAATDQVVAPPALTPPPQPVKKIKMPKQLTNDYTRDCAAVIVKQINTIFKYEPKLLDPNDIEPLHEMRVAINKLRNCLRYLPPFADRKQIKRLLRECRHYKDMMGAVRDFDVTLEEFDKLERPAGPHLQSGIDWVRETIIADREAPYHNLVKETHLLRYEKFKEMLLEYREHCAERCGRSSLRKRIPRDQQLSHQLPVVFRRLRELYYERRRNCDGNFDKDSIHALRLGGKRIRYMLEFFMQHRLSLYRPMRKVIKAIHDTTGEMHDVDVILPYFEARFSNLVLVDPKKAREVRPGFLWVFQKYSQKRRKHMLQFTRQWAQIHGERFEKRMDRLCTPWTYRKR